MERELSPLDSFIGAFDQALRVVFGGPPVAERPNPAATLTEAPLDERERDHAGRLMRINHTGEICAQALYQGQALTARDPAVRERLQQSAREENDHLAWTAERVQELGGRLSYLNPFWYAGALAIGMAAGIAGDRWSLGFLAETERQVVEHLNGHLARLPAEDRKSLAIVEQMARDEASHATVAIESGAAELPAPIKALMRLSAKVMTTTTYWV